MLEINRIDRGVVCVDLSERKETDKKKGAERGLNRGYFAVRIKVC